MRFAKTVLAGFVGVVALGGAASATQLTYAPVNPTFGGNALNGTYLLGVAQAQGFGAAAKNGSSPDLSGLDAALSNLGSNLGQNLNSTVASPIIVIGSPTVPVITSPTTPTIP